MTPSESPPPPAAAETAFTPILRRAVDAVPGAIGAVFADWDGEAVDLYAPTGGRFDMLVLAAHYGIVLNQIQAALHLFHFGEAREIVIEHERLSVLTRVVAEGYHVTLVVPSDVHLTTALRETEAAAAALRKEM